jgi:hypothetical protein
MASDKWVRVLDTIGTLVQAGTRFARPSAPPPGTSDPADLSPSSSAGGLGALGALETRLAGVLVAALKEAFDRDKARMDLERETVEAERGRAERALQAELRRQAADRSLNQLRLIAVFAGCVLLASAALAAFIGGMREGSAAIALGAGWAAALGALGCVFASWPRVSSWAASTGTEAHQSSAADTAPWLLLLSLAFTAASLLMA